VQQTGSYFRLLPRATPGATDRELLPVVFVSFHESHDCIAAAHRELLPVQQTGSYSRSVKTNYRAATQRSSGSYFKIWPDFLGLMGGGLGGPGGPGKPSKMWPHLQIYARRLRLDSCSVRARQEESKRACHTDLWLATAIAFNSKLAVSSVQHSIKAGEPCERVLIENGCRFGSSKNTGNRGVLVVTKHPSATPQCFRHVHV
jgi:hypothetical protein